MMVLVCHWPLGISTLKIHWKEGERKEQRGQGRRKTSSGKKGSQYKGRKGRSGSRKGRKGGSMEGNKGRKEGKEEERKGGRKGRK